MFDPKLLATLSTKPLYKKTKPKPKAPEIPIAPPGSFVAMGRKLTSLDKQIKNTTDPTAKTKLVQRYYEVSQSMENESSKVLNKHQLMKDRPNDKPNNK